MLQPERNVRTSRRVSRLLASLLTAISMVGPALSVHAELPHLPIDPTVAHGTAVIHTVGDHMTVTNSPNAILNWQDFSIGGNQEVYFQQPDASSQVLNRVVGHDPSHILGSLSSNGGVWLINPNGVLFGQNAHIDVAGLVASSLDISNIDFLAGKYNFLAGSAAGQVVNQGEVRTTFGGRVLLAGGQVRNEGTIQIRGATSYLPPARVWSSSIPAPECGRACDRIRERSNKPG